jgi:cytochrome b561
MTQRYSTVAIAMHWLIAGLVIANFIIINVSEGVPRAEAGPYMAMHKSVGISILLFSLFRLFWRVGHKPPPLPATVSGWQAGLGKAVHWIFYFLIIAVPLSGWIMASAHPKAPPVEFFGLFDATLPTGKNEAVAGVGHDAHEILTKPLFLLILLHIIAALKHQFVDRLPFIRRMWP